MDSKWIIAAKKRRNVEIGGPKTKGVVDSVKIRELLGSSRPPNDQRHVLPNLLESTFGAQHLVHLYKYVPEKLSQSMSPPIIKRTLKGALRRQPVFLVVACEYLEGMLHTYPRHRALHRAYSEEYSVAEHTTNLKRRLSTIT